MSLISSISPIDNRVVAGYSHFTDEQIENSIQNSSRAFLAWRNTSFEHRATLFLQLEKLLIERKIELAQLMTTEMGKPIAQSEAEVEKCAWVCKYYAENAARFLSPSKIDTDAGNSFVTFNPLGTILAIMPWNFPFWQVFRFAAPTLMAGNTGLLKHASNVMGCALAIEQLFTDAGFPEGVFNSLIIGAAKVSDVIAHPVVQGVSLTGSTIAGKKVAAIAGEYLKKQVLELGGSDPYLILPDANLHSAAAVCAAARLINGGQSCIAAKRFIVHENVYENFLRLFKTEFESKKFGNPFDRENTLGPQARTDLRDELHQQVLSGINAGAQLVTGGYIPDLEGAYYPPTILSNISRNNPLYYEELFGPVATVFRAGSIEEMVSIANDSPFGLGAAIFSSDEEMATEIASKHLQSGSCFVNASVKSDPRLPFGGIKESGYGRELSDYGIKEFVNIKTVYVK